MIFLKINKNIRTRTDFQYRIEFGRVLEASKSLASISFYEELEIRTLNFIDKTYSLQKYDDNHLISSYEVFELGHNVPSTSIKFKSKITKEGLISINTSPLDNHGILSRIDESLYKFSFNRVHSFLGYETNCHFGFTYYYSNKDISRSQYIKENGKDSTVEILKSFTHEYQYRNTEIEDLARKILSNGWDQKEVKNLLESYKKITYLAISIE